MTINITKTYTTTKDRRPVRNLGLNGEGVTGEYQRDTGEWRSVQWDADGKHGIRIGAVSARGKRLKVSDLLEVPMAAAAPATNPVPVMEDMGPMESMEPTTSHSFDIGGGTTITINVYNK